MLNCLKKQQSVGERSVEYEGYDKVLQQVAAHYCGAELDQVDSSKASFLQENMHICKLITVNLCSIALICFQKALVDNTNC